MQRLTKVITSTFVATLLTLAVSSAQAESRITLDPNLLKATKSKTNPDLKIKNPEFILKADLVATPRFSGNGVNIGEGYCGGNAGHQKVSMIVKNIGDVVSAASVAKVDFGGIVQARNIPAIAPGATFYLNVGFPGTQLPGGVQVFNIAVDANNQVKEKSEANNTGAGQCLIAGTSNGS